MRNLKKESVLALVCFGAGVGNTPWIWAGRTVPPPLPPEAVAKSHEKQDPIAQKPTERLPIGLSHDFGKIKYGSTSNYFLCIVNIADRPIRIISVRASSANHLHATMSKTELRPNEEGKLEVSIDARYFVGRKTTEVWLEMECSGRSIVTLVRITAESVKDFRP